MSIFKKGQKHMKKLRFLMALSATALLLSSCNEETPNSDSPEDITTATTGDSTTSGGDTPVTLDWTSEQKEMLEEYSGEVLPFPEGLASDYEAEEGYDSYYYDLYEIYDSSSTYGIKDYYKDLVDAGWTAITNPSGGITHPNGDTDYFMFTKANAKTGYGYYIQYFYDDGNVIDCYNHLVIDATTDTSWGEASSAIKNALLVDLPFLALGEDYEVYTSADNSSLTDNDVVIYDSYTTDLSGTYASLLQENGFELDKKASEEYDAYILTKDLGEEVGEVQAILYYSLGNYFQFSLYPTETEVSAWPSDALASIEETAGIKVPEFSAPKSKYYYYTKNGAVYIECETTESIAETYAETVTKAGFIADENSYSNWEETLKLTFYDTSSDGETVDGFSLKVEPTKPTSTFSKTWPTSEIDSYLTGEKITPRPLVLENVGSKEVKYSSCNSTTDYQEIYDYYYELYKSWFGDYFTDEKIKEYAEEEALTYVGFFISIYDADGSIYEAYKQQYVDEAWFSSEEEDAFYYEDVTGTLGVYAYNKSGVTYIQIDAGEGKEHTPTFKFSTETYNVSTGKSLTLSLVQKGYKGNPTFKCESESGKITFNEETATVIVAEDATIGETATITATLTVDGKEVTASCTIKVINEVIDELTPASFGITKPETSYSTRSDYVSVESGTTYKATCAAANATIQIRSKTDGIYSGIVAQNASKTCSSISFTFNTNTLKPRTIDIYASNEAFDISDMYSGNMKSVGSVTYDGTNATVAFDLTTLDESYSYIGFRSNDGALYLDSVQFIWC